MICLTWERSTFIKVSFGRKMNFSNAQIIIYKFAILGDKEYERAPPSMAFEYYLFLLL